MGTASPRLFLPITKTGLHMSILVSSEWPAGLSGLGCLCGIVSELGSSLESPRGSVVMETILCVCLYMAPAETWVPHVAQPQAAALEMPTPVEFRDCPPDLQTPKPFCAWPLQGHITGRNNVECNAGFRQTFGVFFFLLLLMLFLPLHLSLVHILGK